MKRAFNQSAPSQLGRDPDTNTDVAFYDWLCDHNPEQAIAKLAAWLRESLSDMPGTTKTKDQR